MKAPQGHVSITWCNTSMDSPDELKDHQRMKKVKQWKSVFWEGDSLDYI
jgi:hypothetical protein